MIIYSRVSVAGIDPVTLDEVKLHLRIDGDSEDTLIQSLIRVATRLCETYAGLSFTTQTRVVKLDRFRGSDVILPYGPVTEVTSIAYVDGDDDPQTISGSDYTLDTQSGISKIRVLESWPFTNNTANNIVITYTAGFGTPDDLPEVAKHAIKMTVALLYQNRGDDKSGGLPDAAMDLLDSIKVYWDAEY
jgi:uncharacterized phiE125 gp8 family phage protein